MEDTIATALDYSDNQISKTQDTIFAKIYGDFEPGICSIRIDNKWGLFDSITKKAIGEIKYDEIGSFADEKLIDFIMDKKYGYLNENGQEIVKAKYDFTTGFSNGLASVEFNEKWGYINTKGEEVIPLIYEMAWTFKGSTGAVKKNENWGFIDKSGKYVLQPIYDNVSYDFDSTGVANVSIGSEHFYINRKGKRIANSVPYEKFK